MSWIILTHDLFITAKEGAKSLPVKKIAFLKNQNYSTLQT